MRTSRLLLRLEWTVFPRWLHEAAAANGVLFAAVALVVWQTTSTCAGIGRMAASAAIAHDTLRNALLVACYLTWLATIAFAWGSRQIQFVDEISRQLRMRRYSAWDRFISVFSVDIAGRQTSAGAFCIPVIALAATALPPGRAAGVVCGLVVLVASSPAVARILGRVLELDIRLTVLIAGLIAWSLAVLPAASVLSAARYLPAGLITQLAVAESWQEQLVAWMLLGGSAVGIVLLDWLGRDRRLDPPASRSRFGRLSLRGFSIRSPRLVELWRELLTGARTRRITNMWVMITAFVLLVAVTRPPGPDPLHRLVFFLIGPIMLAFPFTNVFALDGPGAQAYWDASLDMRNVVLAKQWAAAVPSVTVLLVGWAALLLGGHAEPAADAYCLLVALGILVWHAGCGLLTSVTFPRASDPQRSAGTYAPAQSALAIGVSDAMFIAVAALVVLALRGLHAGGWLAAAGVAFLGVALAARAIVQRVSMLMLHHHQERILGALARSARGGGRAALHAG